jgi:hypothetical protein
MRFNTVLILLLKLCNTNTKLIKPGKKPQSATLIHIENAQRRTLMRAALAANMNFAGSLNLAGSAPEDGSEGWGGRYKSVWRAGVDEPVGVEAFVAGVGGGRGRERRWGGGGGAGGAGVDGQTSFDAVAAAGEKLPELCKWAQALGCQDEGIGGVGGGEAERVLQYGIAAWVATAVPLRVSPEVCLGCAKY